MAADSACEQKLGSDSLCELTNIVLVMAHNILLPMVMASMSITLSMGLTTCPGFPGFCSESFPGQSCTVVCEFGRNNVPLCQVGTFVSGSNIVLINSLLLSSPHHNLVVVTESAQSIDCAECGSATPIHNSYRLW